MVFLRIEEVDWLETAGNYVRVHARATEYRLREALVRLEEQLDPDQFVRISRSAIVNLDRVARLFPGLDGDLVIELSNGVRLPLLAKYRSRVCDPAGRF